MFDWDRLVAQVCDEYIAALVQRGRPLEDADRRRVESPRAAV